MMKQIISIIVVLLALTTVAWTQDHFSWMDLNEDGKVTLEEFIEVRQTLARNQGRRVPGEKVLTELFNTIDLNGNGVLTPDEVEAHVAKGQRAVGIESGPQSSAALEEKVETILSQLTIEEKVAMCLGGGGMEFTGVPRLNLPNMVCTDGPRGPGPSTAFPAGIAFGASWNTSLLEKVAAVMGLETREKGATMLLAPAINILRDPLNGRFFEY
jgi:hypothetical protein